MLKHILIKKVKGYVRIYFLFIYSIIENLLM